jgi:hypothetical protein
VEDAVKAKAMNSVSDTEFQAILFGTYYVGHAPSRAAVDLYMRAMQTRHTSITERDAKILVFALHHPKSLGCIDAGLALIRPQAELRRRLFIMFAVLESLPEYCDYFLPQQRSLLYLAAIGFYGFRSIGRALLGVVLIKVVA